MMPGQADKSLQRLHRLGILHHAVCRSREARELVLQEVNYNTDLIPNRLARVDLLTDSLMHSPGVVRFPLGRDRREAACLALTDVFHEFFGYEHALPVAQGRMAEAILAEALAKPGLLIPNNLLFPTTRLNPESLGARPVALPVQAAYDLHSEHPFKGNIDIDELRRLVEEHGADRIAYIMVEVCNNAAGGHPVSIANLKAVYDYARQIDVPLFLDNCRLLENAWLIREREPRYAHYSLTAIVRQFCSHSDGCTLSATKDYPVAAGGFIACRSQEMRQKFQDTIMLKGDGMPVDAKAAVERALRRSLRSERGVKHRINKTRRLWHKLKQNGIPVLAPASGYAVFIDTRELVDYLSPEQLPERAFLVHLYRESGVLGSTNMLTPEQEDRGIRMLRFAIPTGQPSMRAINYAAEHISRIWHRRKNMSGLQQTHIPPGRSGEFLAGYEPC